jgi:hypothetical protein
LKSYSTEAHRPLNTEGPNTRINPIVIDDHEISWAAYNTLDGQNDVDYYQFEAEKGDNIYASMVIPVIERYKNFTPDFALIGPNLENDYAGLKKDEINAKLEIQSEEGVIVKRYQGQRTDVFFEPFTQTSYWEKQEVNIEAPSKGTYYLAVFSNQNQEGKYVLSIGRREQWGINDLIRMPKIWWDVRIFTENIISTYIITSIFILLGIFMVFKILK